MGDVDQPKQMTLEEMKSKLQAAATVGDMKTVIQLAKAVENAEKAAQKAKFEATSKEREALTMKLKADAMKLVNAYRDRIVELIGEEQAGIDIHWTAAEGDLITVAIMKAAKRQSTGGGSTGGGTPKKYEKTSDDLLKAYGSQPYKKNGEDSGKTLQEAWDESSEKNHRYGVRQQLIKLDSVSAPAE
jgi:hypothetical protein